MIKVDEFLKQTKYLDFNDNWDLTKLTSSIVDTPEGRKIIIHVLEIWNQINDDAKSIWLDLIERAGFYPYYIDKIKNEENYEFSIQSSIRSQYFKSDYLEDVYFHEQQKEIEEVLSRGDNIAVSAPTSFGKSLMIEEIVARKKFDNILIIQPTLALIDETRKKLKKYTDFYNLVVNTKQDAKETNIFILTAERVLEYVNLPKIDFFIIDEFYKISSKRDDSRLDALNVTLLKIMKHKPQSMFLTPTVDSLSEKFRKKYDVKFFKTDYALVNTNIQEIRSGNGKYFNGKEKKEKLFELLELQNEASIVYVKSPNEAYKLAQEYVSYLKTTKELINPELDIYAWIDENVSKDWRLKELLQYGIGTHNGVLPRHVVTTEIELFNTGKLNVLFATSSLIEGVNTVAKNIMVYSQSKGNKKIDYFDFSNIRGRAGRMNKHFTGNVYLFGEVPTIEDFTIDVPAVDQENISDEILVNIPDEDVIDKNRKAQLNKNIDNDLKEIIKKNLISIDGQKRLYEFLNMNDDYFEKLRWRDVPTYDQLWKTLYLGYKFLKSEGREKFAQSRAVMALKLINTTLPKFIAEQAEYHKNKEVKNIYDINKVIDEVFKFQKSVANFEIPKLLAVVESIHKYICQKKGIEQSSDYSAFSMLLGSERVDEKFQFLIDYGVPSSAINKIGRLINKEYSKDYEILEFINNKKSTMYEFLLPYEKNLLKNAIEK